MVHHDEIESSDYLKLNHQEQILIRMLSRMFGLNKDLVDTFDDKFKILLGEFNAGNDSIEIKKQLKKHIIYAMQIGKLSRNNGNNLLMDLI